MNTKAWEDNVNINIGVKIMVRSREGGIGVEKKEKIGVEIFETI